MLEDILGVKINNLNKNKILEKIESFLDEEKFHQIATINPEFILEAQKNEKFKNILNNCDLNVADGIGVWFAFLRFGKYLKARMTGADLMQEIFKKANDRGLRIFLACRKDGLSNVKEIKDAILKIYPKLKIEGEDIECHFCECGDPVSKLFQNINSISTLASRFRGYDKGILFCNFGAPYQEIFINSLKLQNYSKIRLAIGIGGGFDFLTGKIRRAPKLMRFLGLEWLYRLIQEPKYRWKRIFNAVIIFPIKIIFNFL